jgi:hypothetical protein
MQYNEWILSDAPISLLINDVFFLSVALWIWEGGGGGSGKSLAL